MALLDPTDPNYQWWDDPAVQGATIQPATVDISSSNSAFLQAGQTSTQIATGTRPVADVFASMKGNNGLDWLNAKAINQWINQHQQVVMVTAFAVVGLLVVQSLQSSGGRRR